MQTIKVIAFGIVASVCLSAGAANAKVIKPVTFDPPGSMGTFPADLNRSGVITGDFTDGTNSHGFLRNPDGSFITFDVPGAADTYAVGINANGEILGYWTDGSFDRTAFTRSADGKISAVTIPGALDTYVSAINDAGTIAGSYTTSGGPYQGFIRTPDGTITTFDPSGSIDTTVEDMNQHGDVTGYYFDSSQIEHSFVRTADGNVVSFDIAGGSQPEARAINDQGKVAGEYYYAGFDVLFVRARNGKVTTFTVPRSQIFNGATDISESGVVVGHYQGELHWNGFSRKANGHLERFRIKHASTYPQKINGKTVIGYYSDQTYHGFIWTN